MNNQQVAIKFESRKSDAPQLRDEYRTYKVLAGISKVAFALFFYFSVQIINTDTQTRWNTHSILFWSRRSS